MIDYRRSKGRETWGGSEQFWFLPGVPEQVGVPQIEAIPERVVGKCRVKKRDVGLVSCGSACGKGKANNRINCLLWLV